MTELLKALFANATERIKNPLIGTFFMSWIVFNWKAILVLFSSPQDIETRFKIISANYSNIWNLLLLPFTLTIVYIFGLPYINLGIDRLLSHSNRKQSERIQKNKLSAILKDTDIAIANIELEEKQKEYRERKFHNETIESLNTEIKKLNAQNKELNRTHSIGREKLRMEIAGLNVKNNELEKAIIKYASQIDKMQDVHTKLMSLLNPNKRNINNIEIIKSISGIVISMNDILNDAPNINDIIKRNINDTGKN